MSVEQRTSPRLRVPVHWADDAGCHSETFYGEVQHWQVHVVRQGRSEQSAATDLLTRRELRRSATPRASTDSALRGAHRR